MPVPTIAVRSVRRDADGNDDAVPAADAGAAVDAATAGTAGLDGFVGMGRESATKLPSISARGKR
jgi:hypothetical protein